jgi:hypothetical protein
MAALDNYDSDNSSGKENESHRSSNGLGKEAKTTKADIKGKQKEDVVDGNSATQRPSSPPLSVHHPLRPLSSRLQRSHRVISTLI